MLKPSINSIYLQQNDISIDLRQQLHINCVCHQQRLQHIHQQVTKLINTYEQGEHLQLPIKREVLSRLQQLLPVLVHELRASQRQTRVFKRLLM